MDQTNQNRIALLHPKIRQYVLNSINEADTNLTGRAKVRIAQGLRTFGEQDALYKLGRTVINSDGKSAKKPFGNVVTNAKGGQSYHNYGLAVDFVLIIDDKVASWDMNADWDGDKISDWMEVVKAFTNNGFEWGGTWHSLKDYPHFQKTFTYSVDDLLKKYKKKDFISGTNYVNL